MIFEGLPATVEFAGTFFVTTEQAPTIEFLPMVVPGIMNDRAPTNAPSSTLISKVNNCMDSFEKSCVPAQRYAS